MSLLSALFSDPDVDIILSDEHRVRTMLAVEVALAEAGESAGIIPARCVAAIREAAHPDRFDLGALDAAAAGAGNLAIPLVSQLTERVAEIDGDSSRWVHWGATSQDVIDTALVLQLRASTHIVLGRLARAADAAARHAGAHVATAMAGRTWLQQATPVTFGLKAAGWLDALMRASERLAHTLGRSMVLQLGGATGTLAALGDDGPRVAAALGERLALVVPDIPWHAHRDRLADLACAFGIAAGTLGKIARDVALLAQTEIGEAREMAGEARGGSSTMPHKRNPVGASVAIAAAIRAPGLVATMLAAMPQEHERGLGGWQAEWETLPELVRLTAGAARQVADLLSGLELDAGRMGDNLQLTHGLTLAEPVSMALAAHVGREAAHRLVRSASRRAEEERRPFVDVLAEDPGIAPYLGRGEIARRLEPARHLGSAHAFVEQVLATYARSRGPEADAASLEHGAPHVHA